MLTVSLISLMFLNNSVSRMSTPFTDFLLLKPSTCVTLQSKSLATKYTRQHNDMTLKSDKKYCHLDNGNKIYFNCGLINKYKYTGKWGLDVRFCTLRHTKHSHAKLT